MSTLQLSQEPLFFTPFPSLYKRIISLSSFSLDFIEKNQNNIMGEQYTDLLHMHR